MSDMKKERDRRMEIVAKYLEIHELVRSLDIPQKNKIILFDKLADFTIELRKI